MRAKQRRVSTIPEKYTPDKYSEIDSAYYDITYSTSEAGYLNYLNNKKAKIGGDTSVVVYARYISDTSTDEESETGTDESTTTEKVIPCILAYANYTQSDGTTKAELLTPLPAYTFSETDTVTVGGVKWYYLDLQPKKGFKEINIQAGVSEITGDNDPTAGSTLSPVTIANVNKDVFLEISPNDNINSYPPFYDIKDVTRQYTGNFFYTVSPATGYTKTEATNPESGKNFIYVEVPSDWVTGNNTLQVKVSSVTTDENGDTTEGEDKTESCSPSVTLQDGAETTAYTKVCKVTFSSEPSEEDKDRVTFTAYNKNTTTASSTYSFYATYHNGGYYRYIPPFSVTENGESTDYDNSGCYLIFSPQADSDTDQREEKETDINHMAVGNPYDKTNLLDSDWTYSPTTDSKTTSISDNWNGATTSSVNGIAAGTTISQKVSGLTASTPYTVQMIVRGESGATGTMTLAGTDTKTATGSFSGYTSNGTITKDGRVDSLYTDLTNGWHKLEATATSTSKGTLTISLTAASGALQLSDVTLLENANTNGHVWTSAPTSSSVTEHDLSSRSTANAYSFFDRGINHNAIVYVDANTVVGRDANALDIAAATTSSSTTTYSMAKLALTDTDGKQTIAGYATNSNAFKITKSYVTAKNITYDRDFNTGMSTLCLPFALTNADLVNMGISKVYTFNGMSESSSNIYKVDFTEQDVSSSSSISTEGGKPYIVKFSEAKSTGFALTDANKTIATGDAGQQVSTDGDIFQGVYKLDSIPFNQWDSEAISMRYWIYNGSTKDGDLGKFVPARYKDEGTKTILNPFRGYFIVKAANQAKVRSLIFSIHTGDRTTDIDAVEFMHGDLTAPVYNLSGQMVQRVGNIGSLPKGVYIQNHKKFVVR